jgi:predicted regulator of Ras-like GTPase activity (Roadblock/LC7/MglB family)
MDLTEPLKELVGKVPQALGAVLMDSEGEAITHFTVRGHDDDERARLISAYHRIWLSDCQKLTQLMRLGHLNHLIQRYETGTVLIKALKNNHALVLIGEREMFLGQGLLQLNQIAEVIREDL